MWPPSSMTSAVSDTVSDHLPDLAQTVCLVTGALTDLVWRLSSLPEVLTLSFHVSYFQTVH